MKIALILAGLALALTGCTIPGDAPVARPGSTPVQVSTSPDQPVRATEIEIPGLGVRSSLIVTGKNPDGTVEVPDVHQPGQASFYSGGAMPGSDGPAVILGHINGGGIDGVFAQLHTIGPAEPILIHRSDGSTVTFKVLHREQVSKQAFPWERVLAPTPGPELRLITCGGVLDRQAHSYEDNIIVYAVPA